MGRELGADEQVDETPARPTVDVEPAENAREMLFRRVRLPARLAVRGEHPLETGVRGDHGAARVGLGAQVVDRDVEHVGKLDREPEKARTLLGDETWELVRPDRPEPADRHAPGLPLGALERAVASLEQL